MDGLTNSEYELKLTKEQKRNIGFRYDYILEEYIYKFSVYHHNNKALLFCKVWIDEENDLVKFNVYTSNNNLYAPYYNRSNNNLIVPKIDKLIITELKKMGAKKVN